MVYKQLFITYLFSYHIFHAYGVTYMWRPSVSGTFYERDKFDIDDHS